MKDKRPPRSHLDRWWSLRLTSNALAALMRRVGNRWRRALDRYFNPVSSVLDFLTFWFLVSALLIWGLYAVGLFDTQTDSTGLLTLALCISGIIAWPGHHFWLQWY